MDQALVGLRRRLAQQSQFGNTTGHDAGSPNSVVARVRRRNEHLDGELRRTAAGAPSGPSGALRTPTPHASTGAHRTGAGTPAPPSGSGAASRRMQGGGAVSRFLTQVQRGSTSAGAPEAAIPSRTSAGKSQVDERKLRELQKIPKNSSPAMHLQLPPLLPPPAVEKRGKNVLILDIDETLVHASVTPNKPFDVRLTIEVENERGFIFVAFRPGLMEFLDFVAPLFEVVIFTASQSCYADQLMDHLDPKGQLGRMRLFREHCTEIQGARVKDLSLIGRPLDKLAIIDNSPVAYLFQQRNAIPIISWFDDPHDREFEKMMPMLSQLAETNSVYDVLDTWKCTVN